MNNRIRNVVMAAALVVVGAACGSQGSSPPTTVAITIPTPSTTAITNTEAAPTSAAPTSAAPTTTTPVPSTAVADTSGVDPNAPEVVEPGDIPDDQVFVVFPSADGSYSVKVPEGWARTDNSGVVTFTDNYNSIAISAAPATAAPSVDDVKSNGLSDVSADPTFTLVDVKPITRRAGDGLLATYEIGSAPNPVTGKKALLAVERYEFFHNDKVVALTLSGAKGADNVDPWRVVSDSLTWTS